MRGDLLKTKGLGLAEEFEDQQMRSPYYHSIRLSRSPSNGMLESRSLTAVEAAWEWQASEHQADGQNEG